MDIPIRFLPTQIIAPETYLIRQLSGEGLGPVAAPMNSLVIRGAEPAMVFAQLVAERWGERTSLAPGQAPDRCRVQPERGKSFPTPSRAAYLRRFKVL